MTKVCANGNEIALRCVGVADRGPVYLLAVIRNGGGAEAAFFVDELRVLRRLIDEVLADEM